MQHAPRAKFPRLHQRFLAKKYVAQQDFCSRVLLPGKICCTSLFQEQAPSCVLKFALRERVSGASSLVCTCWGTYPGTRFGSVFQEQAPSCVLVGVPTRERVSGASSLVCTGLNRLLNLNNGSECDAGSENVIILAIRFYKVVTGFE